MGPCERDMELEHVGHAQEILSLTMVGMRKGNYSLKMVGMGKRIIVRRWSACAKGFGL